MFTAEASWWTHEGAFRLKWDIPLVDQPEVKNPPGSHSKPLRYFSGLQCLGCHSDLLLRDSVEQGLHAQGEPLWSFKGTSTWKKNKRPMLPLGAQQERAPFSLYMGGISASHVGATPDRGSPQHRQVLLRTPGDPHSLNGLA